MRGRRDIISLGIATIMVLSMLSLVSSNLTESTFTNNGEGTTLNIVSPVNGNLYIMGNPILPFSSIDKKSMIIGGLWAKALISGDISGVDYVKFSTGSGSAIDETPPYEWELPFYFPFGSDKLTAEAVDYAGNKFGDESIDYYKLLGGGISGVGLTQLNVANGVAIDSQEDVIVTGQFYNETEGKFIIRTEKYDEIDGLLIWRKDYGKYNYNIGKAIAVDENDNIYIAGVVNESVVEGFNYIVLKYNKNGDLQWAKTFHNKIYDVPWRIAVDSANHIFVAGMSLKIDITGGIFSSDYWTIKCDSSGNLMEDRIEDLSNTDLAFGIAVDSNNDVIVTGYSNHSCATKYCTLEYDNNLNIKTGPVYYFYGDASGASDIVVDSNDNFFIVGATAHENNKDYLTVKYNVSFSFIKNALYSTVSIDDVMAIATNNDGDLAITGVSNAHFCTVKYNNNLTMQWIVNETFFGGARDVVIDGNNNVIVTGYKGEGANQYYTVKYSSDGKNLWEGKSLANRSLPLCVDPMQETFVVTINVSGYGVFCQINETLPEGCEYVGSSLQEYQVTEWSHGVGFILVGETTFTYNVATPTIAGEYTFYGTLKDMDLNTYIIGGDDTVIVWSPWLYDINQDEVIQKSEVIKSIQDYFGYLIEKWQVIKVIQLYFST